jgi:hypothetical protein
MDETKVSAFLKNMQGGIFQVTKDDTEEDIAMINYGNYHPVGRSLK